jgi:cobalt/nickel transport system permease protein
MHMSDALVSPAVGGAFWVVSLGALFRGARRAVVDAAEGSLPLTGVLGAFVFAIQMITFAIPGTGSSGHLGGGLLLAILLGPEAAFLTLASVLAVQALFFADGGLLAYGCNLFNMGFIPAFVAFPLVYAPLARRSQAAAVLAAATAALGLGAAAVALETSLSGISVLPFRGFLAALVPIHLVIGLAEGAATLAVVRFLAQARPELVGQRPVPRRGAALMAGILALLVGGVLSWAASTRPDGLTWAVARVAGEEPRPGRDALHRALAGISRRAPMPDYDLPGREPSRAGTSLAGLAGGGLTLGLVALGSVALRRWRRP